MSENFQKFYKDIKLCNAKITSDYYSLYANYQSDYKMYSLEDIYNSKERQNWLKKINNTKINKVIVLDDKDGLNCLNNLTLYADIELLWFEYQQGFMKYSELINSNVVYNYTRNLNVESNYIVNKKRYKHDSDYLLDYYKLYVANLVGNISYEHYFESEEHQKFLDVINNYAPFKKLVFSNPVEHELCTNIAVNLLNHELKQNNITREDIETSELFHNYCRFQYQRDKKLEKTR